MVTPVRASATRQLVSCGQSPWLDYIRRGLLTSGEFGRMVADGWITGVTSNPTIFEKAIAGSTDYDDALAARANGPRIEAYDAFVSIAIEDIRLAADALRPIYDATQAVDGYVSFELPPGIEHDAAASVAEAKRLFALLDRPNVMIKVPGTPEGCVALEELIASGVNSNMTLLFAISAYERCVEAYLAGLERRLQAGEPLERIASVASFFVSRLDTAVDAQLPKDSPLRGKAAVANARVAYAHFLDRFRGPRWERLAAAGARVQRPLWASTGTKDAAYSDVVYVERLVAENTVNTMPEATLRALLDHGKVKPSIVDAIPAAERDLAAFKAAGIDLDAVTAKLLVDGLASFEKDFVNLLDRIGSTIALNRVGGANAGAALGPVAGAVRARLAKLAEDDVIDRIWSGDYTLWKPEPAEISNRLGWIPVIDTMIGEVDRLRAFAAQVAGEGYTTAVVLGMGGSSLAPEVLQETFGPAPGMLDLHVLDTTDPEQILAVERGLDLAKTLFIVSSKSGGTIETLSHFAHFWGKQPDGNHFVAITDAGTSLEALARAHGFREVFLNPPDIGGRYSALSYFGLVPAALLGVDIQRLLDRGREMRQACRPCVSAAENPGAWLGGVLGEAALAGHDKLTFALPPPLATLGYWIEQLIAESTGKEGKGIIPVEGEPLGEPAVYGKDRLFVAVGDATALASLESAGQPVVRLGYSDPYQIGAEFVRWEFATAVAGSILGINPFDQPNVQEAKDATARILAGEHVDPATPSVQDVLAEVKPGDYIAITAYVPRSPEMMERLGRARVQLRDRYHSATTLGFGPRFQHSTGQLHKGGPNTGIFLQIVGSEADDVAIPGQQYTFGALERAQALGDLASLRAHGRRVARCTVAQLEQAANEQAR